MSGDWVVVIAVGAISCRYDLRLDGAFKPLRGRLLSVADGCSGGDELLFECELLVVESATSSLGLRMGTNADLTTSIGSSSESSESCGKPLSLWWCWDEVGLLEDGRDDETGDR